MSITRRQLIAAAALATLAPMGAGAQTVFEPRSDNEKIFVESVKARLSPCFTMLGAHPSMPRAAKRPPDKELLASVLLPAGGPLVHDGYNYLLLVHTPSNAAYVVQYGGFAGSQAVFGPIPLNTMATTCR